MVQPREALYGIKRDIEKAVGGKIDLKIDETESGLHVQVLPQTLRNTEIPGGEFFDHSKKDLVKKVAKHVKGEEYYSKSPDILEIVEKKRKPQTRFNSHEMKKIRFEDEP